MTYASEVELTQRHVDVKTNDTVKVVQGRHKDVGVITRVQRYTTNTVSNGYQQIAFWHCIDTHTHTHTIDISKTTLSQSFDVVI